METRVLGRSGIELPVIGFGCGPNAKLMVGDDHRLQSDLVRYAIEQGVDYFDTAAGYGDGRSEANLGNALRDTGAHPKISTKVVLQKDDLADVRSAVLRNFEASLGRLRLARVEALMLHNRVAASRDYKTTGIGAVLSEEDVYGRRGLLEAFDEIVKAGQTMAVGFTAFGGQPESVRRLVRSGEFGLLNASFNAVNPSAGMDVANEDLDVNYQNIIGAARQADLGVMAIRVLSSGSLVRSPKPGSREERIAGLAAEYGESVISFAIRYVLSKPGVHTAIVGFSERQHIDDAVAAARSGPLDPAAIANVEDLARS